MFFSQRLKVLILSLLLAANHLLVISQNFEGSIIYKMNMKYNNISNRSLIYRKVLIKDNNYLSEMYIDKMEADSYTLRIDKNIYFINDLSGIITKDISKRNELYPNFKKSKKKVTLLGYNCTVYHGIRNTRWGKDTTYLSVADSLFTNIEKSPFVYDGRVILRSYQLIEGGYVLREAVEIKKKELEDYLFELPNYPIEKKDMSKLTQQYLKKAEQK